MALKKSKVEVQKDRLEYRQKLGIEFCANLSFIFGIRYPLPVWYENLSRCYKIQWYIYCRFGILITLLLFISNLIMICQSYNDIRVFVTCLGTMTYIICITLKLLIFRKNLIVFVSLLDKINQISENLDNNPVNNKNFFQIHKSYNRHVKIFGISKSLAIFFFVGILAVFAYCTGYLNGNKNNRSLPMAGWYPYNPLEDTGFLISCFFQFVAYLSFLLKDVAIDLIFLMILVTFNSYLIYLRKLLKIITTEKESENDNCRKKSENLIWWIKQYQLVLRTIEDFKIISDPYLFAKYISVGIILFLGGVLVTSNSGYNTVQQVTCLSINGSNLIQLYIFSVIGDNIAENAMKVAEDGFNYECLTSTRKIKSLYFYTLCRTRKPVLICFGSINPLTVNSFGQVWSAFVLEKKIKIISAKETEKLLEFTWNYSFYSLWNSQLWKNYSAHIVKMTFSYFTTIVQIRAESNE